MDTADDDEGAAAAAGQVVVTLHPPRAAEEEEEEGHTEPETEPVSCLHFHSTSTVTASRKMERALRSIAEPDQEDGQETH